MGTRTAIYVRLSKDRKGEGLGVERQLAACQRLAEQHDWEVTPERIYQDNSVSAYSGRTRPRYQRMIADIEAGKVDAVAAWAPDRLHRSVPELGSYIDLTRRHGVITRTVQGGELDVTGASAGMLSVVAAAIARGESELRAERILAAKAQAKNSGGPMGGPRPFGFESHDGPPVPSEAGPLEAAIGAVLAGSSLRSVVTDWNRTGIRTATGAEWTVSSLRRVLLRERNTKIVDPDIHHDLVALLTNPSRLTHNGTSLALLGSHLFTCGVCGRKLASGGSGSRGRPRYACVPTGHLVRVAEPIDALVRDVVAEVLVRDGVRLLPSTVDTSEPRMRAAALRVRLDEIADKWGAGELTTSQFDRADERAKAELAAVEEELARLSRGHVLAGIVDTRDAGAAFRSAPLDRQRAVIDLIVDVTVLSVPPGRRSHTFDPASVKIVPKANS